MVWLSSGSTPNAGDSGPPLSSKLRQIFLDGVALTIPLLITLMILAFVVNFILQTISPVVESRPGDGFERVFDVDLSVEEGIRSIVTGGVATGERDPETLDSQLLDLDEGEIDEQAAVRHYMLNRTHESGAAPETTPSPDESLDESGDAADSGGPTRPTEQDGTAGDAAGNDTQADGDQS